MICDELKVVSSSEIIHKESLLGFLWMNRNDVNKAIAELKQSIKIKDDLLIENGKEIGRLKSDKAQAEDDAAFWKKKYKDLHLAIMSIGEDIPEEA